MSHKVLRKQSYVLIAMMALATYTSIASVGDDGDFADRFVAFSVTVSPWFIGFIIVWTAGQVLQAISGANSKQE